MVWLGAAAHPSQPGRGLRATWVAALSCGAALATSAFAVCPSPTSKRGARVASGPSSAAQFSVESSVTSASSAGSSGAAEPTVSPREPVQAVESPSVVTSLVLDPLGQYGRSAVFSDPVLDQLARDPAWAPAADEELRASDGRSAKWRALQPNATGALEGAVRGNSWWFQRWRHTRDEVLLLESPGAGVVYGNAAPRMGDLYRLETVRIPVALRAGENDVFVRAGRGAPSVEWSRPPAPVFVADFDRTLPDAIVGESGQLLAAVVVVNATEHHLSGLGIEATLGTGASVSTQLPELLPLEVRKVPVSFAPPAQLDGDSIRAGLVLRAADGARLHDDSFDLAVRKPTQHHARTFLSRIDHSVQYYAVVPAAPRATASPAPAASTSTPSSPSSPAPAAPSDDDAAPALILSLHGASVEASGQAAAYTQKDWAWVVAPTNRRPFGFDWEDWGRRDAIEVLDLALAGDPFRAEPVLGVEFDRRRVYLTGHSMGGHGAWQIGARYAGRFAAIAPSAGWSDFWSYTGGEADPPADPIGALLHRASNGSRTLLWSRNYAQLGVYVLHGDADDNVPVREARRMREELARFHPDFAYFEQPGAGHWWGNECVDWPPLMEFLRRHQRPSSHAATEAEVRLVDLDAERTHGFATLVAQTRPLLPSELQARAVPAERRFEVQTTNVEAFELRPDVWRHPLLSPRWETWPSDESGRLLVDGVALELLAELRGSQGEWRVRRKHGAWRVESEDVARAEHKRAGFCGPFKESFDAGFVLVYGAAGSPEENAWALAKARFDAEQFRYRGNASPVTISDRELLERWPGREAGSLQGRNVVLYGNAKSNEAWSAFVDSASFDVQPGRIRVGTHTFEGDDLSVLAVRPNARDAGRLVGLVGGTGVRGMRALNHAPYFVSGAGFPDWWVARSSFLRSGLAEHVAAGFFRGDWSVDDGPDTVVRASSSSGDRGR